MTPLPLLTAAIASGRDLSVGDVNDAVTSLASADVADADKEAFLLALAKKGERPAEIAAFARAFRDRAVDPGVSEWSAQAIDIVGTGGDHAGGFNISSLVTLVLASAGVTVMKHGNRGVTSKCGSADLLAGLGVNLEATPDQVRRALKELGYVFFFAPAWHPAFKAIAPTRKALAARGHRTVFNILGPLINPGRPARTLLGVATPAMVGGLSAALEQLGGEAGLVVHGTIDADRGIDEMTTATTNLVQGTGRLRAISGKWTPESFGLTRSPFPHLQGGDREANLALTEQILSGRAPAGLIDTIVLNAAAGLWISGKVASVREGLPQARERLLGGAVAKKIADTREFYRS